MAVTYSNVLMHKRVNSGSDDVIMYPTTADDFVKVESNNTNLPSGTTTLDDIVNALGALAFANDVGVNYDPVTDTVTFS